MVAIALGALAIIVGSLTYRRVPGGPPAWSMPFDAFHPTATPEPIIPTPTTHPEPATVSPNGAGEPGTAVETAERPTVSAAGVEVQDAAEGTPVPSESAVTPAAEPAPTQGAGASGFVFPEDELFRLGVSLPYGISAGYTLEPLEVRWVMDWAAKPADTLPDDVAYVLTVRMKGEELWPVPSELTEIAAGQPGSLWLVSNEPDVIWQDNVTPEVYARLYYEAYRAIKAGDPTAIVAAGGIAQPTELRLRYLDRALAAYEAAYGTLLPAQAWQIHNYMLREERDSWGVDIPPGIADDNGVLYEISDSANLIAFEAQIWLFRRWMSDRGYGHLPLIVSEFGIPMPAEYGFPPELVETFLRETWRIFLTLSHSEIGYPQDGRLVQAWCWFSMGAPAYPTGNLINLETGEWTHLGRAWISMVGGGE